MPTEVVKLELVKKTFTTKEGKTFPKFLTKMNIIVKGEESQGEQIKWIDVKFRKDVLINGIGNGTLCGEVSYPYIYEVKEENGKSVYPTIWIRRIDSFVPMKKKDHKNPFVVSETEQEKDLPF